MIEVAGGILLATLIIAFIWYLKSIFFYGMIFLLIVYIASPRFSCDWQGLTYNLDTRACGVKKNELK